MRLRRRGIAVGATLAVVAAAQFAIFSAQPAFAADVANWSDLQDEVSGGTSGTITLTADITGAPGQQLSLPTGGSVRLDLDGHTLDIDASSASGLAGIHVAPGMSLTITDSSAAGTGHLIARGGLTTSDNGGAGIGGNAAQPGGSVTIEGGTVDAYAGYQAAGIGGANFSGGTVTISGGTVNAFGGFSGAGIGGGWSGSGGTVTISGGTVHAVGGFAGAGIGGGNNGSGGTVIISGGEVSATAGNEGFTAAIGGSVNGGTGSLDVFATPFGATGTGGGGPGVAPTITPHATSGLRYAVTTSPTDFHLQFGQVLSFDTAGGSDVPDQFVPQGATPTTPAPPTFAGYVFLGWSADAGQTAPFDFSTPVTADVIAYARWAPAQNAVGFDLNGHGTAIPAQLVDYGETATAPPAPTATGYTFGGWYTDAALTAAYDFATPVTGPVMLHAKWTADAVTVTFDPADGSATTTATVDYGATVSAPADPKRTGYTFTGWFTDQATTTKYDFAQPVTGDLHLYAGWAPVTTTPSSPSDTGSDELANTGSDVAGLIGVAGLLLLGGGVALLVGNRRRRPSTPASR